MDLLVWYAGQMNPSTMADSGILLIERAMKLRGESSDLLAMLSALLWSSGQAQRAARVDVRLKGLGFELGIQGQIEEYLTLYNRISAHQRETGRIPLSERTAVTRVVELENLLNLYWSIEPIRIAERRRSAQSNSPIPVAGRVDVLDRLTTEHRFVCGGSVLWVSMWRDERRYDLAMHRMKEVFSDWELVRLICASNKPSLEALLNNGCAALLDSPSPEALPLAHRIMTRALDELPEPELSDLNYHYACVFARCGDVDSALDRLRRCLAAGESRSVIRGDSDFDLIREDDRFEALLAS